MRSLKLGVAVMALYSGFLFGLSTVLTVQLGYIDRYATKAFGLSVIGTLFCLLVLKALHRRGLL